MLHTGDEYPPRRLGRSGGTGKTCSTSRISSPSTGAFRHRQGRQSSRTSRTRCCRDRVRCSRLSAYDAVTNRPSTGALGVVSCRAGLRWYCAHETRLVRPCCLDVPADRRRGRCRHRGGCVCNRISGSVERDPLSSGRARFAESVARVGARRLQRREAPDAVPARRFRADRRDPLGKPAPYAGAEGSQQQDSLGVSCLDDAIIGSPDQRAKDGRRGTGRRARFSPGHGRPGTVHHRSTSGGLLAADFALVRHRRHARPPLHGESIGRAAPPGGATRALTHRSRRAQTGSPSSSASRPSSATRSTRS